MESFLFYFSLFFAFLIISVAVYLIYSWRKDQKLHKTEDELDSAHFDIDLIDTARKKNSRLR